MTHALPHPCPASMDINGESMTACPICGCPSSTSLWGERWGFLITRCGQCGVGRTVLPHDFSPLSIYSEDYFRGQLRDGYADYVGSRDVIAAESLRCLRALREAGRVGGRLLEIGCAYGYLLEVAREWFEVAGLEVCEEAVASCRSRGLDVTAGVLNESFVRQRAPIDAVVMMDVIEHLSDPVDTLRMLGAGMATGSHLMLTTGDWGSSLARLMGSRWRLLTPPQHLYYFTARSLDIILRRTGFDVISMTHPGKAVSLGLVAYQLQRLMGVQPRAIHSLNRVAVPVNLLDAFRVIAVRNGSTPSG